MKMHTYPSFGSIEIIAGSMFSGKTEELIRRLKRCFIGRQKTQVFKPEIDVRYSETHVQSHDATRIPSIRVANSAEILTSLDDNTRVVGIDEAQFFDDGVIEVAQKLASRGIRVIIAGLDLDFKAQPFGPMPKLMAVADQVSKLTAICLVCGGAATRTQRIVKHDVESEEQILVGAQEHYEPRCRICHEPHPSSVPEQLGLFTRVQKKNSTLAKESISGATGTAKPTSELELTP